MRLIMFFTSITLLFNWFNDAKLGVKTHQNKKNGNARLATKEPPLIHVD
jgi:hypothetical protein